MIKEPLRDAYENALIGIRDDREYLGSVLPAYTFAHDLSALQQEVKGYGLIRSRHNSGHVENGDMNSLGLVGQTRMELNGGGPIGSSFGGKQPPISRPISSAGNTNSLGKSFMGAKYLGSNKTPPKMYSTFFFVCLSRLGHFQWCRQWHPKWSWGWQ